MDMLDPAAEWQRLSGRYRQMSDDELLNLSQQGAELTEVAQQALASEISQRRLKLQPEELPVPANPVPTPDSSYDEDRELVDLCTVWSLSDALQLQTLLDRAGIPFFMGPEKATGVDAVTSSFVNGVGVQVMRVGLPWAHQAMRNYTPVDERGKQEEQVGDLSVRCPKCQSAEVVFESMVTEPTSSTDGSPSKYEWTCDSCGHQWEDDGVVEEE